MYSTPSQICLMNSMLSLSVKVKSSATTLSKSSPPEILGANITNKYIESFKYSWWNHESLLFRDHHDLSRALESGSQQQKFRMPQHVHDPDLFPNLLSILRLNRSHEFRREIRIRRFFDYPPHGSVSAFTQFLQYLVSIVEQMPVLHFDYSSFERWIEFFDRKHSHK